MFQRNFENKILSAQERKACKLLNSFGVAKINPATLLALKKLHPERKSDLVLPSTAHPQINIDSAFVAKRLFLQCADRNMSKDVYGWAPWMFYFCRGEKKGFFNSFVLFSCFSRTILLSFLLCALYFSGGALTPLHKLGPGERKLREDMHHRNCARLTQVHSLLRLFSPQSLHPLQVSVQLSVLHPFSCP